MNIVRKNFFIFVGFFILVCGVSLALVILQRQQNERSGASNQTAIPPQVCGSQPANIMLIIDKSGSMNSSLGNTATTKIASAKAAASNFVKIISANIQNHIGLTTFQTTATLNSKLTNTFSTVTRQINQITAGGDTCTQCGAKTTDDEINTDSKNGFKKVVILLTDGIANTIIGTTGKVTKSIAEAAAITEIQNEYAKDHVIYFTIGLGNRNGNSNTGIDEAFLQKIAQITGGKYYYSPTTDDLNQIYQDISQIIGKGSISGNVFNDVNGNGYLDAGEQTVDNWKIDLKVGSANSSSMLTTLSASTSGYSFPGLCDGTYYVDAQGQNEWTQTAPANPSYYTVTITNGNANTDKNFGMKQQPVCGTICTDNTSCSGATAGCTFCNPTTKKCSAPFTPTPMPTVTPTLTPSSTPTLSPLPQHIALSITALLHNIGNSGDNANPNAFSFSNKNPLHPQRNVQVFIYNVNNDLIASPSGTITYDAANGNFTGTVDAGNITPGQYYLKIATDYHLRRLVPGVLTLKSGTNTVPSVSFVAGDVDNSNDLSILDYNQFLSCYGSNPTSCTAAQKVATDFNDDGSIDEKDYNLFIRELSVQNGE